MRIIFTFCTFLILFGTPIFGQKGNFKKATQLFKEDKYALAIPFFKKALAVKSNLSTKTRLAYCYKITNQMAEAATLYEEIVQHERAKTKTYLYYAETLMSSGKYDDAKIWFKKYAAIETDDETIERMIASCDFAKTAPPYFGNVAIAKFLQNSDEDDNAPVFWKDKIIFTSDRKGKLKLLDTKSGATGRSYLHLYSSQQLPNGTYDKPKEYVSKINDARKNTGMATFQTDGSTMFFTRNGTHLSKQNAYCLQLFEISSVNGQNWKGAKALSFCKKEYNYMHPAISSDGQFLFFVSDKPRGNGGTDIYISKKTKKGWGKPENLGEKINTKGHEGFPFMHQNGKLYFCSKGHLGLGGFDVFVTQKNETGEWETPVNLGAPINSSADDISIYLDKTEQRGLFTSSREGGDDDIFILSFAPKAVAINQQMRTPTKEKIATNTPKAMNIEDKIIVIPESKPVEVAIIPTETIKEEAIISEKSNFLQITESQEASLKQEMLYALPSIQYNEEEYFVTFKIAIELDKIAAILKKHPSLKIELASHTANLGNYTDRIALTRYRAEAMASYLEKKGIKSNQLLTKGYGGELPLNKCLLDIDCSIEEHAINDRIEVKILSNNF